MSTGVSGGWWVSGSVGDFSGGWWVSVGSVLVGRFYIGEFSG